MLERSPLWSSYSISFMFHFLLILALACLGLDTEPRSQAHSLTIAAGLADETPTAFFTEAAKTETARGREREAGASEAAKLVEVTHPDAATSVSGDVSPTPGLIAADPVLVASGTPIPAGDNMARAEAPGDNSTGATGRNLMLPVGKAATGGGLEGRGKAARAGLVKGRGGSSESEDAVERGLAWLAAHQRADGSWRFNHQEGPCRGLCADPGTAGSTTAATGLALLTFLGAGETEQESPYKAVVEKGLYYLTNCLKLTPHGGDLQEGTMYGQGIAAIALCEAYAMTGDESLQFPAQK
ncbi:MAG: hypothetical protein NTY19_29475, partial [Planctomycetota bacterium]|nr:hypothetical protein [Planctomycetota bacterium]